jgi:hypothetical protein
MISFWIDYGTNYVGPIFVILKRRLNFGIQIGGVGAGQKEAAWRIPLALQLVPAVILGIGIIFMPFSPRYIHSSTSPRPKNADNIPRWLVNQGRNDEALQVLSYARGLPEDSELVQIEFLFVVHAYTLTKLTISNTTVKSKLNISSKRWCFCAATRKHLTFSPPGNL